MATNEVVEPTFCVELNGNTLIELPLRDYGNEFNLYGMLNIEPQIFIERMKELNIPYFILYISGINKKDIPEHYSYCGLYVIKECKKTIMKCDFYDIDKDDDVYNDTMDLSNGVSYQSRGIKTIRFNSAKCKKNITFRPSYIKKIYKLTQQRNHIRRDLYKKKYYINIYVATNKIKYDKFNDHTMEHIRNIMMEKIPIDIDITIPISWELGEIEINPFFRYILDLSLTNNELYKKVDISTLFLVIMDYNMSGIGFIDTIGWEALQSVEEFYNLKKNEIIKRLLKFRRNGIDTFLFLDFMIEIKKYKKDTMIGDLVLKIINEYRALIDTYHNKIFKLITSDILVR
jgi:hypothetical protein